MGKILFLGALLLGALAGTAQDTLLLMNGKRMVVTNFIDTTGFEYEFRYDKNATDNFAIARYNRKLREKLEDRRFAEQDFGNADFRRLLDKKKKELKPEKLVGGSLGRREIFSIPGPNGKREVLYERNPAIGNFYYPREMRDYIIGEGDARLNFRARGALWGSMAVGSASGYALEGRIISFTVPVAVGLLLRIPVIKVNRDNMSSAAYVGNQNYLAGYEDVARDRLMIQGLKGSAIGLVAGILLHGLLHPDEVTYL